LPIINTFLTYEEYKKAVAELHNDLQSINWTKFLRK
jgi:hypothetical protein